MSPHVLRPLVLTKTEKRRMAQMTIGSPLDESDLRDDFRRDPLHILHLLRCHAAAPVRRPAARKIDEGASRRVQRLEV